MVDVAGPAPGRGVELQLVIASRQAASRCGDKSPDLRKRPAFLRLFDVRELTKSACRIASGELSVVKPAISLDVAGWTWKAPEAAMLVLLSSDAAPATPDLSHKAPPASTGHLRPSTTTVVHKAASRVCSSLLKPPYDRPAASLYLRGTSTDSARSMSF